MGISEMNFKLETPSIETFEASKWMDGFNDGFNTLSENVQLKLADTKQIADETLKSTHEKISQLKDSLGEKIPEFDYAKIGSEAGKAAIITVVAASPGGPHVMVAAGITGGCAGALGEITYQVAKHNGASEGVAQTAKIGAEMATGFGLAKAVYGGVEKGFGTMENFLSKGNIETIPTLNSKLEGFKHPETGVIFEKNVVSTPNGRIEGVFPKFDSIHDFNMQKENFNKHGIVELSDTQQFKLATRDLASNIESNPSFAKQFTEQQIEIIKAGRTPGEFTWHHSEKPGLLELVDKEIHAKTAHTGGAKIWTDRHDA